jgi:Mrp family chromosome partitioning ATPase
MSHQQLFGSIGRIIAVTSCKGGVGKSTVSFGIAARLAARGHRVGIYDADVNGPSLPTQVSVGSDAGVSPAADGWSMPPLVHDNGLKMMSFGWLRSACGTPIWGSAAEVDPRGAGKPGALVVQLLHTTVWGELDYLIVDTPPGTGEIPMALAARGGFLTSGIL